MPEVRSTAAEREALSRVGDAGARANICQDRIVPVPLPWRRSWRGSTVRAGDRPATVAG